MVYAIQNIVEAEKFIMRNYHRRDTMLKRKIEQSLNDWKNTKNHKPLIIKGCRQCGKIFIYGFFTARTVTGERAAIVKCKISAIITKFQKGFYAKCSMQVAQKRLNCLKIYSKIVTS